MTINIKDNIPPHIALMAVLSVVSNSESDENGKMVYPKLSSVPVRGATIMVKTEEHRKSDCFKVWLKKD